MLSLLGLLFGPVASIFGVVGKIINPLGHIVEDLADAKVQMQLAKNDEERIRAAERVTVLETRKDLMVAEAPFSRLNIYIRSMFAIGPLVYLNKIFIWDKVLAPSFGWGAGRTDALDTHLWWVAMAVVGFYFLDALATRFWKG